MSTSLKPLGLAVALVLAGCNQAAAPADSASAADMADAAAVETMAEAPAAEAAPAPATEDAAAPAPRSEAHTSELQSLMRTSYVVFRSKKKNYSDQQTHPHHPTPSCHNRHS